jgi:hypothetical protein
MSMTSQEFVERLVEEVPETSALVSEHLEDQFGELVLHLLMADLLRFAVERFHQGQFDVSRRCLALVDHALGDGDEYVRNAVAVSFVENVGYGEGETAHFIASWPQRLLDERASQERHQSP